MWMCGGDGGGDVLALDVFGGGGRERGCASEIVGCGVVSCVKSVVCVV